MLSNAPKTMSKEEFRAKYPLELETKFKKFIAANKAGDKAAANQIVGSLSKAEKDLFKEYKTDVPKLIAGLKSENEVLEEKKKEVLNQYGAKLEQKYAGQATVTISINSKPSSSVNKPR